MTAKLRLAAEDGALTKKRRAKTPRLQPAERESRKGKKAMLVWVDQERHLEMKYVAHESGLGTLQSLLETAIDMVLEDQRFVAYSREYDRAKKPLLPAPKPKGKYLRPEALLRLKQLAGE